MLFENIGEAKIDAVLGGIRLLRSEKPPSLPLEVEKIIF